MKNAKDKAIDNLLLLIAKKNRQIKELQETINYAIGGINALKAYWQDEGVTKDMIKEDVFAIRETLEKGCSRE